MNEENGKLRIPFKHRRAKRGIEKTIGIGGMMYHGFALSARIKMNHFIKNFATIATEIDPYVERIHVAFAVQVREERTTSEI